jgi:hypothetical protein
MFGFRNKGEVVNMVNANLRQTFSKGAEGWYDMASKSRLLCVFPRSRKLTVSQCVNQLGVWTLILALAVGVIIAAVWALTSL